MTAFSDFSASFATTSDAIRAGLAQLQQQLAVVATEDSANRAEITRLMGLSASLQSQLTSATAADALKATEITRLTNLLTAANAEITRLEALIPPPTTVSYLSDLTPVSASNGWGPFERDRRNGEQGANDGGPIVIRGTTYAKGLGVHAPSVIVYPLGGFCHRFRAVIGIDDYVPAGNTAASVTFRVLADGTEIFASAVLTRSSAPVSVDVPVTGVQSLRLEANPGASQNSDHADWADARLSFATQSMLTQFINFQAARGVVVPPAPPSEPPPTPPSTIPMSWDDPMFTGMTERTTAVDTGQAGSITVSRQSVTMSTATNTAGMGVYGNPNLLVDTCRIRAREGIRGAAGNVEIRNTYVEATGQGADHADALQIYAPGGTGTMTIRNCHFRVAGSVGTPNAAYFSSDNWMGNHVFENVILSGGGISLRIEGDGGTNASFTNVFIEPTGSQYLGPYDFQPINGRRVNITTWENVRFCTIVNGVLVPGALIPRPY